MVRASLNFSARVIKIAYLFLVVDFYYSSTIVLLYKYIPAQVGGGAA